MGNGVDLPLGYPVCIFPAGVEVREGRNLPVKNVHTYTYVGIFAGSGLRRIMKESLPSNNNNGSSDGGSMMRRSFPRVTRRGNGQAGTFKNTHAG